MKRRTLVLSDVHLSTLVRGPSESGSWMVYRRPEHAPDALLARTIEHESRRALHDGAAFELVLNGDLFDLDAPPASDAAGPSSYATCRHDQGAAGLMTQILDDHPVVTGVLRDVLTRNQRVVFVPGNHDAQLALPSVRIVIARALLSPYGTRGAIIFRSWFHRTHDGVHIEHGHLYDPLCTMERLFAQRTPTGEARLEDTIGSVSTHYGQALFGLLNPYAVDPFAAMSGDAIQALKECIARAACRAELATLLVCMRELMLIQRSQESSRDVAAWLALVAQETGVPPSLLETHRGLAAPKADAADLTLAVTRAYDYGKDVDTRLRDVMRKLARLHQVRAVVMGHTHEPFSYQDPSGVYFANSGSWTPLAGLSDARPVGSVVVIESNGPHFHLRREDVRP